MKKIIRNIIAISAISVSIGFSGAYAQDATPAAEPAENTCESNLDLKLDVVSSYVWRGLNFGTGPAFQSTFEYTSGYFTFGVWSNINTGSDQAFEADLYASYELPGGLTVGLTDYYLGGNYFGVNFENIAKTHSIEPSITYDYGKLTFFGALMFMEGKTSDFYGEIKYGFEKFDFAIGAGEGQYTENPVYGNGGDFAICNLTISKEKEIKITDKFSLPMKGGVTLNPSTERFYAYVGITF